MYGQYPVAAQGQYGGGRAPAGYEAYASSAGAAHPGMPGIRVNILPRESLTFGSGIPMIPSVSKVLSVPDAMVGVVVGRGGTVIKELMMQSGAKISVRLKT
jgi:hypothetical protein